MGVRHAHLFCIDDVHYDATLLNVKDARVIERQEMHTFSIWARPDLTYTWIESQDSMPRRRLYRKKKAMGEEIHTPNVPKLLFPASFTRVGAQTVDPTLLFTRTICGEALITSESKTSLWLEPFNLQRK